MTATNKTQINRPWMQSFAFNTLPFSEKSLDQFYKLSRNYVASLNLGCPNVRHTTLISAMETTRGMDDRQLYLEWVRGWKKIYAELTRIIRQMKTYRRTIRFPKLTMTQKTAWQTYSTPSNDIHGGLRSLSARHLGRLAETAQMMLNARYNAKLASAERRRRLHAA